MPPRLTQAQRDAIVDSQKWEFAIAFLRANNLLESTIKKCGAMSKEAKIAQHTASVALKRYKKWRLR